MKRQSVRVSDKGRNGLGQVNDGLKQLYQSVQMSNRQYPLLCLAVHRTFA